MKLQVHQVDQMKEELAHKEAVVAKVNYDRAVVEKDMENLKVRQPTPLYRPIRVEYDWVGCE